MTNSGMVEFIKKLMELDEDYYVVSYVFKVGPKNTSIPFKGELIRRNDKRG